MVPLIQFNMKNITNINIPVGIGLTRLNLNRLLASKKCEARLTNTFHFTVDKVKNNFTQRQLYSTNFSPSISENNYIRDEDKINTFSPERGDKYDGFRIECNKQEEFLSAQLQIENNRADQITNQEWDAMRNLVLNMLGTINEKSIDAVIMNKCAESKFLSLGKSYFKYLKSTNKTINRATYGNFLRLFFLCNSDCTSEDLNEIVVVYKELSEVYPILDSNTAEKVICALSLTSIWKEYEKLFGAIKQFYHPSPYIYKIVILTAFDHQEFELGWNLMEEMQYHGLNVPDEVFLFWFQKVKYRKSEEDLIRVLNFLNYFNMKPSDEVCRGIKEAYKEYNEEGKVTIARIARNGECRSCHSKLEPCNVSQEDFDQLKQAFLNPVIIGKDIFQKTKPEEFKEFLNLLKKSAPFDVVLDGLNIALHGSKRSTNDNTYRLKSVVKHFVNLNKKILVLGRKHMASWRSPNMDYVCKNAHVFLTDNLSQDDPFMLYAALYSGLGSCFVSRDLMRGHKFLLANPKLQITFQKWQSTHQYFIVTIGTKERVFFQELVSFLQTIQQNPRGDWHIPFVVKGEDLTTRDRVDHLHRHWLCMQKKSPVSGATHKPHRLREPTYSREQTWENDRPVKKSTVKKINLKGLFSEDGL